MDDLEELLRNLKESLKEFVGEQNIKGASLGPELCERMACFGTPSEIAKLINAGYGNALRGVMVEGIGISQGGRVSSQKFPMVQLSHDQNGCAMHKNGKCLLMESGLTPAMGMVHLLTNGVMDDLIKEAMIPGMVMEWVDSDNRDAVRFCLRNLEKINELSRNHTN